MDHPAPSPAPASASALRVAPRRLLHVTRGFSAQPTLSYLLPQVQVRELPLAEAVGWPADLVWASCCAAPEQVSLLRSVMPRAVLLVSVPRRADPGLVVDLFERGADQVMADEGVAYAAATLTALARRRWPDDAHRH